MGFPPLLPPLHYLRVFPFQFLGCPFSELLKPPAGSEKPAPIFVASSCIVFSVAIPKAF